MDARRRARLDVRARVMKALGHPTRLFLVEELARGERCVGDLTELVGADVSTVSRHLGVLRGAGLLVDERRGAQVVYRLAMPCVTDFLSCVEAVVTSQAEEAAAGGC